MGLKVSGSGLGTCVFGSEALARVFDNSKVVKDQQLDAWLQDSSSVGQFLGYLRQYSLIVVSRTVPFMAPLIPQTQTINPTRP